MALQTVKGKYPEKTLYELSDILTTFAMMENAGTVHRDYGTGILYTPAEVHTISYIADHPGCSNSQISAAFAKTLGATSQVLNRLKKKDLIRIEKSKSNRKILEVYLTEQGEALDKAHRKMDTEIWEPIVDYLLKRFSEEEINSAFTVIEQMLHFNEDMMASAEPKE